MSIPVVCIVGPSGAGKTLTAQHVVKELTRRSYRVAAVKHAAHGHQMDRQGTDSDRLLSAGAASVTVVSPGQRSTIERSDGEMALAEVVDFLGPGYDIVIAEGFKGSDAPKIVVLPERLEESWPVLEGVIAVVSKQTVSWAPWQCGPDRLDALVERIVELMRQAKGSTRAVDLRVDGKPIPLNPFAAGVFAGALQGMLTALKGVPPKPKRVWLDLALDEERGKQAER